MVGWKEQLRREIDGLIILGKMALGWRPDGPEDIDGEYWGVCPYCGGNDRYLNVGRAHWFVCHRHRVKWWGGENVFGTWRHQTIHDWRANARLLSHYQETDDPVYRIGPGVTPARVRSVRDAPPRQVLIESRGGLLDGPAVGVATNGGQNRDRVEIK